MEQKMTRLSDNEILKEAKRVLEIEASGILGLIPKLNEDFVDMVRLVIDSRGKVIITGVGKSGLIGKKIVATLNSTGTPSIFLHPVEALHGDLGMISNKDVVIAISNSGETRELNDLIPLLKGFGAKVIAFTGKKESTLAKLSDLVIDVGVEKEACSLGLAPTASTTAALAMGDALSVVLTEVNGFSREDFFRYHPGGSLGERLSVEVKEVMITGDSLPLVKPETDISKALDIMSEKDLGTLLVVDEKNRLLGIVTDGDLRRALMKYGSLLDKEISEIMTHNPLVIKPTDLAVDALNLMEERLITALPIVDKERHVLGIIHLHDLLGRGTFRFTRI